MNGTDLNDDQYRELLDFRTTLREFLHWSAERAEAAGLTPAEHQLLLAVRGNAEGAPTIGDVARALLLRHHSAVQLVDRAEAHGLLRRQLDAHDRRVVRLVLTPLGRRRLRSLSELHAEEIARLAPALRRLSSGDQDQQPRATRRSGPPWRAPARRTRASAR